MDCWSSLVNIRTDGLDKMIEKWRSYLISQLGYYYLWEALSYLGILICLHCSSTRMPPRTRALLFAQGLIQQNPWADTYISNRQSKYPLPVVVKQCHLLRVLQLLLDPSRFICYFMRSGNVHMDGKSSHDQLEKKRQVQSVEHRFKHWMLLSRTSASVLTLCCSPTHRESDSSY